MNKKTITITIFLIIICLVFILLMKLSLNKRVSNKIIYKKSQVNTTANMNDNTTNSKTLVKQIKYRPSRIIINANYKDTQKIMAKDIYLDNEIKELVEFLNSIEYEEQIKSKSEVEEWDFLIHLFNTKNKTTESITFYKNRDNYVFRNDIAGVRISKNTYDKFLNLYKSFDSIEVHCSEIK